jgi:hypothetical protein
MSSLSSTPSSKSTASSSSTQSSENVRARDSGTVNSGAYCFSSGKVARFLAEGTPGIAPYHFFYYLLCVLSSVFACSRRRLVALPGFSKLGGPIFCKNDKNSSA